MIESAGEVRGMVSCMDTVRLDIILSPEDSTDPSQIFEWRIGEKVKVVGNEPNP